ncbi:MAG TPA: response regulator [Pyrinomonadaceae bacterium]|jgi:CheY-like chemotaxis protein|nr:response regulator [Pyrinomonadaceae bacterium]
MIQHRLANPTSFPGPVLFSQFLPSEHKSDQDYRVQKASSLGESQQPRAALVVDDVSDVTDMFSVLLTHAGYDVTCASTASEALALARKRRFDVVISDIGMPEMNGYELAEALRSLPGYTSVPLVAVTGYSMFDDRTRSLTAGFNEHVTKPIDPRAFLDLIEQL